MSELIYFILGGVIGFGIGGHFMAIDVRNKIKQLLDDENKEYLRLKNECDIARNNAKTTTLKIKPINADELKITDEKIDEIIDSAKATTKAMH